VGFGFDPAALIDREKIDLPLDLIHLGPLATLPAPAGGR
jgi:hypothetical protein